MGKYNGKVTVLYETNEITGEKLIKGFEVYGKVFLCKKSNTLEEYKENVAKCYNKAAKKVSKKYNADLDAMYTKENITIKKVTDVDIASYKLRNRIRKIAPVAAVVITMTVAGITSGIPSKIFSKSSPSVTTSYAQDKDSGNYTINEEDQTLRNIYKKLLKYDNGKEIVKALEKIDDNHEKINKVAIANPDANGKVSYIEAEELAAISDVYNSQNSKKTLLETEEEIRCNYFTGQAALINLSQGSRDVQEIDSLFKDKDLKEKMQELQKENQKTLDNLNMSTPEFIKMLNEIYKNRETNVELQAEVAFGQSGVAAALSPEMTGKTLENYQYASKTNGGQLSGLINDAIKDSKRAAVEDNEINLEKQALINEALEAIDAKRLKGYDRTDYDPSTTAKGKDMVQKIVGDLGITAGGDYVEKTTTKTTTTTKKVSRAEAVKIFGESAVQKAEQEADKKLDEMTNQSQEQGNKDAQDRAAGYAAGQKAFTNGGPSTTSTGSKAYQQGYREGYQHAKSVYDNQVKEENKTEETFVPENPTTENPTTENTKPTNPTTTPTEPSTTIPTEEPPVIEEWFPEPTTQSTQSTQSPTAPTETKQIIQIERDGVTYETEAVPTASKSRSYGAIV